MEEYQKELAGRPGENGPCVTGDRELVENDLKVA